MQFSQWFKQRFSGRTNQDNNMGQISINGQTYTGNSITVNGGRIIIDGVEQLSGLSGIQEIKITGGSIENVTSSASVSCGDVTGNVDSGGSTSCGNVGGNVTGGGSVNCGNVVGNVRAGGSINCRK